MNTYDVTLYESYAVTFQVQAESQEEAYDKANGMYWEGEVEAAIPVVNTRFIDGSIISADLVEEKPSE